MRRSFKFAVCPDASRHTGAQPILVASRRYASLVRVCSIAVGSLCRVGSAVSKSSLSDSSMTYVSAVVIIENRHFGFSVHFCLPPTSHILFFPCRHEIANQQQAVNAAAQPSAFRRLNLRRRPVFHLVSVSKQLRRFLYAKVQGSCQHIIVRVSSGKEDVERPLLT